MVTNNFTSLNPTGIYAIDVLNDDSAYVWDGRKQDYTEISKKRLKRLQSQARAIVKEIDKACSDHTTVQDNSAMEKQCMRRYKLILQHYLGIKWLTFELKRAKLILNSDIK